MADLTIVKEKTNSLPIPHVGWNECKFKNKNNTLFDKIENNSDFYFTHSYFLDNSIFADCM